ncbi:hypothetical protein LPB140_05665 [Sphingorhabdus lutea]|uniref:SH3b domain-containing protein n=1 Tax=Sphingorhabdus lutea TaxID=1913578 RepID=A0A1L3JB73_9SPHN|nr:SH3 domain-containing protein [Sphingorhabdus lutea]APG62368.1 hypothetical protein LPB140_05665 [Sphingorhabdus lutea]
MSRHKHIILPILSLAILTPLISGGFSANVAAQTSKQVPYWSSIKADEARTRTGPSTDFPVKWIYRRAELPVKVVAKYSDWRKVEDPDGDQGWMHVKLLSTTRSALVTQDGVSELREEPSPTARISWRVEKGVVGKVSDCVKGWCKLDVKGRYGYIETSKIWGEEAL